MGGRRSAAAKITTHLGKGARQYATIVARCRAAIKWPGVAEDAGQIGLCRDEPSPRGTLTKNQDGSLPDATPFKTWLGQTLRLS